MAAPGVTGNLDDFHLDILGQHPRINRLYTQITLCFPVPDESHSQEKIIDILTRGIEHLSANFRWIAGKVVVDADGILKIKPFERNPRLTVKDYRQDRSIPDWNVYQRAKFPFSMLDEMIIAPYKTLALQDEFEDGSELPVFLIQANFVTGGLLLTFNGQHGTMDMAGQAHVIQLLAKACRNESFTPSELRIGNMDRRNLIPLLDNDVQDSNVGGLVRSRANGTEIQPPPQTQSPPSCTWAYFSFPKTSLDALKSFALKTVPPGCFVSTDDALSAFIWQSVTRARQPRFSSTSMQDSTLTRNVDVRRYFSIPSSYPGLVTPDTIHTSSFNTLAREPLGIVATQLRSALDPESLRRRTSTFATHVCRKEDREKMSSASAASVLGQYVRLSSWAKEDCYNLDFGFGRPEAVRRPRFTEGAREGLVYLLPRTSDGEIVVGISLREEDLDILKRDEVFQEYGMFIG